MNDDIKVLAKLAMELSKLPATAQGPRTWEAVQITGSIIAASPPAAIAAFQDDLKKRFGPEIDAMNLNFWKEGPAALAGLPWLYLKTTDGKPPAIAKLLEAALGNKGRKPADVLLALQHVPAGERAALTDQVRAFNAEVYGRATAASRREYLDYLYNQFGQGWSKDPWQTVLDAEGRPAAVNILLANASIDTNAGDVLDDNPADDTMWANWVRTWDPQILASNPLAKFYTMTADTAEGIAEEAKKVGRNLAWLPTILVGGIGVAASVVAIRALLQLVPSPSPTQNPA